jgi:Glycoside hydrolase family 44
MTLGSRQRFIGLLLAACLMASSGLRHDVAAAAEPSLVAYDGGLKNGWVDLGWGPRTVDRGPARVDVGGWQGWILGKVGTDLSDYATLSVRMRIPAGEDAPLMLARVGSENDDQFPTHVFTGGAADAQRWTRYDVPVATLNPDGKRFDRLLFMASREVAAGTFVELDAIILTGRRQQPASGSSADKQRAAGAQIDCGSVRLPISPAIYGIAFNALTEESQRSQFTIGATTRRWGGDPTSRFNWENGNVWNPGHNWYWRNMTVLRRGNAWQTFFKNNAANRMTSALTVPMLGWVAKDSTSFSFPISKRGAQQQAAPELPDAGNGVAANGDILAAPSPQQTSRQSSPAWVGQWVAKINSSGSASASHLDMVFLDNEPDLWSESHRDVRTEPTTYDELLEKGIAYATAVRAADSDVKIAGPSAWGWWGYFFSAADAKAGFRVKPDRRAHGDQPFLEWYLAGMAAEEKRTGRRLLDVLDVHYYPSGVGVYSGTGGNTDNATNELRVRSTRSLWDRSYKEEGWVDSNVYLLPRLREIVKTAKPGIGISIGEYSFGGEHHISGAVAQAEALGRFGQFGISAAYLWTHPAQNSEQYWGFRAFRNYDGKGSNFGSIGIGSDVTGSDTADLSVFASTDPLTRQKTVVLVNRSSSTAFDTSIGFSRCGRTASAGLWSYAGGASGYSRRVLPVNDATVRIRVAPWSVQVLRVE